MRIDETVAAAWRAFAAVAGERPLCESHSDRSVRD
jgi:hypothetical protein